MLSHPCPMHLFPTGKSYISTDSPSSHAGKQNSRGSKKQGFALIFDRKGRQQHFSTQKVKTLPVNTPGL